MAVKRLLPLVALALFLTSVFEAGAQTLFAQQPPGSRNPHEFTRGPYLVSIQFRGGIASEITIRRAQSNTRVRPDLNVAAEFAPPGFAIAGARRNGRDPPGLVDYHWWEWDSSIGGRPIIVRLHAQSYLRPNPSLGNEIGDLADMRWSYRSK
jgi:hypothetical protein